MILQRLIHLRHSISRLIHPLQLYDTDNPYKSGVRKGQPRVRNVMQGDRIEHIDYITEKDLDLDYEFYITNQIMNPVKQVLDLGMDSENTDKLFLQ